jgi:hypothetical protein
MFARKYKAGRKARTRHIRRLAGGLAYAYVFFLLFPHFDAISHVHAGADSGHHHDFLSAHDVGLERAALTEVPQGVPNAEIDPGMSSSPKFSAPVSASFFTGEGGKSLTSSRDAAHTHFQEDPNLPGLGTLPVSVVTVSAHPPAPESVPGFVPALAAQACPARAPPRA